MFAFMNERKAIEYLFVWLIARESPVWRKNSLNHILTSHANADPILTNEKITYD